MSPPSKPTPSEKIESLVQDLLKRPKKVFKALFYIRVLIGGVLVGLSLYVGFNPFMLITRGLKTKGQIIRYDTVNWVSRDESGTLMFHSPSMPVVEFSMNEQKVQFQDHFGTHSSGGVHSEVDVLYDPSRPNDAMIERGFLNWIPWAPMLVIGVLLLLASP